MDQQPHDLLAVGSRNGCREEARGVRAARAPVAGQAAGAGGVRRVPGGHRAIPDEALPQVLGLDELLLDGSRRPRLGLVPAGLRGNVCLPDGVGGVVAEAGEQRTARLAPGVQRHGSHLGDVHAQRPVDARALNADQQAQVNDSPVRLWRAAVGARRAAQLLRLQSLVRAQLPRLHEAAARSAIRLAKPTSGADAAGTLRLLLLLLLLLLPPPMRVGWAVASMPGSGLVPVRQAGDHLLGAGADCVDPVTHGRLALRLHDVRPPVGRREHLEAKFEVTGFGRVRFAYGGQHALAHELGRLDPVVLLGVVQAVRSQDEPAPLPGLAHLGRPLPQVALLDDLAVGGQGYPLLSRGLSVLASCCRRQGRVGNRRGEPTIQHARQLRRVLHGCPVAALGRGLPLACGL
mmetsp:Transcript_6389/g.17805  ORF Transcript_6389/g.17805 Transcript_6389/m.17805 type:complete len:404 (+) Transcript_6389:275-1486(+)